MSNRLGAFILYLYININLKKHKKILHKNLKSSRIRYFIFQNDFQAHY